MVGGHGAGYSGREHVGGAYGEAEPVGGSDGEHGGDFGGGALSVGEMFFADFFSYRYYDSLPTDHGAEAQGHGYGDFDPSGDEAGGGVDVLFVVVENFPIRGSDDGLLAFLHEAQGFAGDIHIVAEVAYAIVGNFCEFAEDSDFIADSRDQLAQGEHGVGSELPGTNVVGDFFAFVADNGVGADIL